MKVLSCTFDIIKQLHLQSIKKILVGIAFSPNLKPNIFEAVRLANMFEAQLVGVHVGEKTIEKEQQLSELISEAPILKFPIKTVWQKGKPVDIILQTSVEENIDLLILGALQQENLFKYYVGSVARELTRKANCSVLLLIKPSIERVKCNHIVVNGLKDKKTIETIQASFLVSKALACKRITIVEEISQKEIEVIVSDDHSLRKATIEKEKLKREEDARAEALEWSNLKWKGKTVTVIYYIIAVPIATFVFFWLLSLIGIGPFSDF